MARGRTDREFELSRRAFLVTTGGALAGVAAFSRVGQAAAGTRHTQRAGVLHYGSRTDVASLDAHRHNQNHIVHATAAMYNGLTDIDQRGNIVPSLAESWEPNPELTAWTFRLRKGVLFHNGREFDAEAVKLNILRIQDPAIGGADFLRAALENVDSVEVLDRYTVRIKTKVPEVGLPSSVMRYPIVLMAPDAFETAADHPIGTGPFKFVSWTRWNESRLVRFDNYWETDAEGHSLPYLDEIVWKPKREDSVRLTALRTGQVQLIDDMAQADIARFTKDLGAKYNSWQWHSGGSFVAFNWLSPVFQDKRLRIAAAHAIDRNALHHAVYYGQGAILDQPYPESDPWHLVGIRSLEYDPEKAKGLLKEARAVGTQVKLIAGANTALARETVQVIQASWDAVGLKVTLDLLDTAPFVEATREGKFDARLGGHTYRYDPDDFFGRNLHSKSQFNQVFSRWYNDRYDRLVEEAKRTADMARRKELYTEAWNIVNAELPQFHLHEVVRTSAADKILQGYQPGSAGALTYQGGGLRTAYMASS
jgi:peptide/nickel transport system substrate-binding protein